MPGLCLALGNQRQTRQITGWSPWRGYPALGRSRQRGAQGTRADVWRHLCLSRLEGEGELLAHSGWGPGMLSDIPRCTENDQASNVNSAEGEKPALGADRWQVCECDKGESLWGSSGGTGLGESPLRKEHLGRTNKGPAGGGPARGPRDPLEAGTCPCDPAASRLFVEYDTRPMRTRRALPSSVQPDVPHGAQVTMLELYSSSGKATPHARHMGCRPRGTVCFPGQLVTLALNVAHWFCTQQTRSGLQVATLGVHLWPITVKS